MPLHRKTFAGPGGSIERVERVERFAAAPEFGAVLAQDVANVVMAGLRQLVH